MLDLGEFFALKSMNELKVRFGFMEHREVSLKERMALRMSKEILRSLEKRTGRLRNGMRFQGDLIWISGVLGMQLPSGLCVWRTSPLPLPRSLLGVKKP